jgi:hypothetical protein
MNVAEFIAKWRRAELTERSASQQHFLDLCELLDHPKPAEVDPRGDFFTFEKGGIPQIRCFDSRVHRPTGPDSERATLAGTSGLEVRCQELSAHLRGVARASSALMAIIAPADARVAAGLPATAHFAALRSGGAASTRPWRRRSARS